MPVFPGFAPDWTPYRLPRLPRGWVDSRDVSWSGTTPAKVVNRGSDKALTVPAINGTWARGAPIGNVPTLRNGSADNSNIGLSLGAWSTGQFSLFWFGASRQSSGVGGIAGNGWPGTPPELAYYLMTGGDGPIWFGNECCTVGAGGNVPSFSTGSEIVADTLPHSMYGQVGATQSLNLDGTGQILSANGPAAVPNYIASVWSLGNTGSASGESLNGDTVAWLIFDYWLAASDVQRLEGYYHHLTMQQSKLAATHPYKNSRP